MLSIVDNRIKISFGDTIPLCITFDGYKLEATDKIVFAVKQSTNPSDKPLINKIVTGKTSNKVQILLTSTDTQLPEGKYYWDCSVTMANGTHHTLNFPCEFIVEGVVHND